jgi:ABC-type glutathione transport system ATPase component
MEPQIEPIPSENKKPDKRFLKLTNSDILFKPPFTAAVIGAIGSGKSSFVYTLVNKMYKNYWDECIIIVGTLDAKETWENINQRNVLFLNQFDDDAIMDYVKEIEQEQIKRREEGKSELRVLLLLDDVAMEGMNRHREGTLERLIMNCRHYNISILFALQHSKQISAAMRNQIMHWVILRLTANDLHKIAEEHSNLLTSEQFVNMYNDIQMKGKYEFLIVDYKKDLANRFSHRFTNIINQSDYI